MKQQMSKTHSSQKISKTQEVDNLKWLLMQLFWKKKKERKKKTKHKPCSWVTMQGNASSDAEFPSSQLKGNHKAKPKSVMKENQWRGMK